VFEVTASIKALQDLQSSWSESAVTDRKAALMKQLKAKEEELQKDKKMMKVLTLEKKLAEKKLRLQKLIDAKNAQAAKQQAAKEAAEQQEMVAKVMEVAKSMKDSRKKLDSDKLKPVMKYLESRKKTVGDSLAKLDADEEKRESEINALTSKKMPAKDGKDPLAQSQAMLKMLAKKEKRAYLKARAPAWPDSGQEDPFHPWLASSWK
jgi:hypothetical protein